MAAHVLAEAHNTVPPRALAPLRSRLAELRLEADAASDPERKARLTTSVERLDTLIRQLEHGHAPT